MNTAIHYQLQLTAAQVDFLADNSYGHCRMKYFLSLVKMAALKPYPSLVVGSTDIIGIGMVERSIKQLSEDWKLDYKTAKEIVNKMNALGIIATESTKRTSTHKLLVVAAWIVDSTIILNPCFCRGFDKHTVHAGDFDSTAIAEEFNAAMDESIAYFKSKLPKGGRGKKKSSADGKVLLPTILGLELYGRMSDKGKAHSEERATITDNSQSSPTQSAVSDGSVTLDDNSIGEIVGADEYPSVDSSSGLSSDSASPAEHDVSCSETSVTATAETPVERHTSGSDDASEPLVEAHESASEEQG